MISDDVLSTCTVCSARERRVEVRETERGTEWLIACDCDLATWRLIVANVHIWTGKPPAWLTQQRNRRPFLTPGQIAELYDESTPEPRARRIFLVALARIAAELEAMRGGGRTA